MKAEKLKIDNEDLNLPYTTMDVLLLSNIVYIEDLFNCSYDDLLSVKWFWEKKLDILYSSLRKFWIDLKKILRVKGVPQDINKTLKMCKHSDFILDE